MNLTLQEVEQHEFENFLQKLGLSSANRANGSYLEQLVSKSMHTGEKPATFPSSSSTISLMETKPSNVATLSRSRSLSSERTSPRELKDYCEDPDEDMSAFGGNSALNFSKLLNKQSAERKEMTMGDDEPPVSAAPFGRSLSLPQTQSDVKTITNILDRNVSQEKTIFDDESE